MSDIIRTTARFQEAHEPLRQKPIIQIDENYNNSKQLPNTIRSSMDSGRDNPFKPDGIIYKSADPIVDYYKYGPNQSRAQSPTDSQLLIGSSDKERKKRKRGELDESNKKSCFKRWFCCCCCCSCSCFKCGNDNNKSDTNNNQQKSQQPPIVTIITNDDTGEFLAASSSEKDDYEKKKNINVSTSKQLQNNKIFSNSEKFDNHSATGRSGGSSVEEEQKTFNIKPSNKSLNIEFVEANDNQIGNGQEEAGIKELTDDNKRKQDNNNNNNTSKKKKKKKKRDKEEEEEEAEAGSTQAKTANSAKSSNCIIS